MYDQGQRKIILEIHAQKFVCLLNPVINCFWGYSAPLLNIRLFDKHTIKTVSRTLLPGRELAWEFFT